MVKISSPTLHWTMVNGTLYVPHGRVWMANTIFTLMEIYVIPTTTSVQTYWLKPTALLSSDKNKYRDSIFGDLIFERVEHFLNYILHFQDSIGSSFSDSESFIGRIAYMDVWSRRISTEEMFEFYTTCEPYQGVNLLTSRVFRDNNHKRYWNTSIFLNFPHTFDVTH